MMTDYFDGQSSGVFVLAPEGSQCVIDNLDSYSRILTDIRSHADNTKFAIDSSWERGDIYYASKRTGMVKKIIIKYITLASLIYEF